MSRLTKFFTNPARFFSDAKKKRAAKTASGIDAIAVKKAPPTAGPSAGASHPTPKTPPRETPKPVRSPSLLVLQCDDFHINERNFPSLFAALKDSSVGVTIGAPTSKFEKLIKASGNYSGVEEIEVYEHAVSVGGLEGLLSLTYHNVPILRCAIGEALSASLATEAGQDLGDKDVTRLAAQLWEIDRSTLVACAAAAMFWTDHWRKFKGLNKFHAAIVFSGSYIYGQVLMHLLQYTQARCFVIESFMTGFDYYFEERYGPLANATVSSLPNVFNCLLMDAMSDQDRWARDKVRAINKIRGGKNKNVTQPAPEPLPKEWRGRPIALILGQVANDYSIATGDGRVLCAIPVYKELISHLLSDPDQIIVFKAHPWERKKQNVHGPFTKRVLEEWSASLSDQERSRLFIVEDQNLDQLLGVARGVFCICSQAGLNAALAGFKPYTIGGAFYDVGGFTNAFDDAASAASSYLGGETSPTLSLSEFSNLEDYLAVVLQRHLINADLAAKAKVLERLKPFRPQAHNVQMTSELGIRSSWG